jgi:hypothetical protein
MRCRTTSVTPVKKNNQIADVICFRVNVPTILIKGKILIKVQNYQQDISNINVKIDKEQKFINLTMGN